VKYSAVSFHVVLCLLFCTVKYERIKFLVIALPDSIDIYAWAPKPYHKFMVFKVCWDDVSAAVFFACSTYGVCF